MVFWWFDDGWIEGTLDELWRLLVSERRTKKEVRNVMCVPWTSAGSPVGRARAVMAGKTSKMVWKSIYSDVVSGGCGVSEVGFA